jgi:hypothetical protein
MGEKGDIVGEQYNNACKLGANWDGQDFKNHANQSQKFIIIIYFCASISFTQIYPQAKLGYIIYPILFSQNQYSLIKCISKGI